MMKTRKLKLRRWVKDLIILIIGFLFGIAIYQLFTITETKITPMGSYTCNGGLVKICSGSNEVAEYLGVK